MSSFFLLGIAASGQSVGFAAIAEQCKTEYIAIGLGLNNTVITVVSSINAPIIGFAIDSIKTTKHATLENYQFAFCSLIAIACFSAVLAIFFIKETYCKSAVDYTYLNNDLYRSRSKKFGKLTMKKR